MFFLYFRCFFIYITNILLYNITRKLLKHFRDMLMKTGAIILAARRQKDAEFFQPLQKIDGVTTIRRLIVTLKHSCVSPIVVITGEQGDALEKEIGRMDVICLRNKNYQNMQMFESIQMGLRYIERLCDRILILPAKFSFLLPQTISKLLASTAKAACPTFEGRRGHPVLIDKALFPILDTYSGDGGLRAAMNLPQIAPYTEEIPVEDTGIIHTLDTEEGFTLAKQRAILPTYCTVNLSFHREESFFQSETAHFLQLIAHSGSMQTACKQLHISYSKGWKIIKTAESFLGFPLISTQSGGTSGGSSSLTTNGKIFLDKFLRIEKQLNDTAEQLFHELFSDETTK